MSAPTSPWTERMLMVPVEAPRSTTSASIPQAEDTSSEHRGLEFNVATFNILAESYLSPRSHPGLPPLYAATAFDKVKRRSLLIDTLRRFCDIDKTSDVERGNIDGKWDIICFQELDLVDEVVPALESWGYQVVRTSNEQRVDSCAIAFDSSKFSLVDHDVVEFDNLATLAALSDDAKSEEGVVAHTSIPDEKTERSDADADSLSSRKNKPKSPLSEINGMARSFLRRNMAIIAHLEEVEHPSGTSRASESKKRSFMVACAHLYWNPGYEYVKLCQSKYLLDRVRALSVKAAQSASGTQNKESIPVIVCGDMNSKPGSLVHQYFVNKSCDAR